MPAWRSACRANLGNNLGPDQRNENLPLIGKTDVRKSGLAIGLLREACLNVDRGGFYNTQGSMSSTPLSPIAPPRARSRD